MTADALSRTAMVEAGDRILNRVSELRDQARRLYYAVMLFQRECVSCGACALEMLRDSWCRCRTCGGEFDPTPCFQRCPDCDSTLMLKRMHYWCPQCRTTVRSRFCFDEAIFDPAYFREMMRESRERKREAVERMREMLASCRSSTYFPTDPPIPDDADAMDAALSHFLGMPIDVAAENAPDLPPFDLDAYRHHLLGLVPGCVVDFEGVSRVIAEPRLDRIYRFIAAIFMDHAGELRIEQDADGGIALVGT